MDDRQKQKRTNHLFEVIEKLKNPNHIVSKTRIVLKNIQKKNLPESQIKTQINQLIESKTYKLTKRIK